MKKKEYNFSYGEKGETETAIMKRVEDLLIWQNPLVERLISDMSKSLDSVFCIDDLHNYMYYDDDVEIELEEGQEREDVHPDEMFMWYAFAGNEWQIEQLRKAGVAVIISDYGYWVGRGDYGSAWDLYFLPLICDILYNTED